MILTALFAAGIPAESVRMELEATVFVKRGVHIARVGEQVDAA